MKTRERIIREARDVYRSVGYSGATNAAVATRAGVTRPAVNYHFTSKLALFDTVVEHSVAVLDEALDGAAAEPTPASRLRAIVTAVNVDPEVRSATAFLLSSAVERQRHTELRRDGRQVCTSLWDFLAASVDPAMGRTDTRHDGAAPSVVDTLYAALSGMVLYGGNVADGAPRRAQSEAMMLLFAGDLINDPGRYPNSDASLVI